MSQFTDRDATALLVVDVQNDVMAASVGSEQVTRNVVQLVEDARRAGAPVVWVQDALDGQTGTQGWELVPELPVDAAEPLVHKVHGDAFEATELEDVLARLGVGRLVVAGAQSDACVRATLHGAFVRGYDVALVSDAHTTEDLTSYGAPPPEQVVAHTNLYWQFQTGPGRTAEVVSTADAFAD